MRLLIGTLYTIENEFDDCVAALRRQTHRDWEHFVVDNLPNKVAHETLYGVFMKRAGDFDLFVKVDADMVIEDRELFAKIVDRFRQNPSMDLLTIQVHDFFSDRLISGMHTFRSGVEWRASEEQVFTDDSSVPRERSMMDSGDLPKAVTHCRNPSSFQAFHFGVHKGIKVLEGIRQGDRRSVWLSGHWDNIELTWQHFLRCGDSRLGLASLGAELALRNMFRAEHLNYSSKFTAEVFRTYEGQDSEGLRRIARRLRRKNWGFLPVDWRQAVFERRGTRFAMRRLWRTIPHSWRAALKRRLCLISSSSEGRADSQASTETVSSHDERRSRR